MGIHGKILERQQVRERKATTEWMSKTSRGNRHRWEGRGGGELRWWQRRGNKTTYLRKN